MKAYPVYDIQNFETERHHHDLYINTFKNHLIKHSFIEQSHRHNFYLMVLFTSGNGSHKIDLDTFDIGRGSLFLMKPGQVHSWTLSEDIEGYIMFYSQEVFNLYFGQKKIEDYSFLGTSSHISEIKLRESELTDMEVYFKLLVKENQLNNSRKEEKLLNLLDIILIEISRMHLSENNFAWHSYSEKVNQFMALLEMHVKTEKSPSFYAFQMSITLKHLNRICKEVLNQTVTELISQKVVLESKRLLTFSDATVGQVAEELGFVNLSYFTKIFKKHGGLTPSQFKASLKV